MMCISLHVSQSLKIQQHCEPARCHYCHHFFKEDTEIWRTDQCTHSHHAEWCLNPGRDASALARSSPAGVLKQGAREF